MINILNKIVNKFRMDGDEWSKIEARGLKKYLIEVGVLKIGLLGGPLILLSQYLSDIKYNIVNFNIIDYFYGYLIYLPFFLMLIGPFFAGLAWGQFSEKFKKK